MVKFKRQRLTDLTTEERQVIMDTFSRWSRNRHDPDRHDIRWLFAQYHKYVYHTPKDTSCPSCVQFIYNYWQKIVTQWQNEN